MMAQKQAAEDAARRDEAKRNDLIKKEKQA